MKVEGSVKVYLIWDDEAGRWVVDPVSNDGYGLDWSVDPVLYDDETDTEMPAGSNTALLDRAAQAAELTLLDLTLLSLELLGETRASSPNLINAIEKIFGDVEIYSAGIPKHSRDYLMAKLLPLFTSVDANAVMRTRADVTTVYVPAVEKAAEQ